MSDLIPLPKALTHKSVIKKTKPKVWWSSVEGSKTVNQDMCPLAMKVLSMPSSSASIERVFSISGIIQNKLRNRLGIQKTSKLFVSYRFFRWRENIENQ